MKKLYFLVALNFLACISIAQSLSVSSNSTLITGEINTVLQSYATVQNTGTGAIDVKVERSVNNLATGHESYFCWASNCYPPNVSVSPGFETMQPGDINNNFLGDLTATDPGTSEVTYCFFDNNNPSDSSCITFVYVVTLTSIAENENGIYIASYPNPSSDFVYINYSTKELKNPVLNLFSVTGMLVSRTNLTGTEGVVTIQVKELPSGIYFASLTDGASVKAVQKIAVVKN